jgi:hypothetical protein
MVCPQCHKQYELRVQCPSCDVRLHHSLPGAERRIDIEQPDRWQQTPWGRIIVGVLLAEGLYFGLHQLCTAVILGIMQENSNDSWGTLVGLVISQALQGACLILGGTLAGAGQRRGFAMGAMVGAWTGIIFVVTNHLEKTMPNPVALYGLPVLQIASGALGGCLGAMIWKPMPSFDALLGNALNVTPGPKRLSPLAGPIAWARVFLGAGLTVVGAQSANLILQFVLDNSKGTLNIESHLQAQLVTWEITGLAMLVGSAVAGATTFNGLKQGLAVGIAAAAILTFMRLSAPNLPIQSYLYVALASIGLGGLGGWFGGQLFPPVYRVRRNIEGPLTN